MQIFVFLTLLFCLYLLSILFWIIDQLVCFTFSWKERNVRIQHNKYFDSNISIICCFNFYFFFFPFWTTKVLTHMLLTLSTITSILVTTIVLVSFYLTKIHFNLVSVPEYLWSSHFKQTSRSVCNITLPAGIT